MPIGFDCGTFNLVCCIRDEKGQFSVKREVNAFLEMPVDNHFVVNMMKTANVPIIEHENMVYALGEKAVDMAYAMNKELKRPMSQGCVNPKEVNAFDILNVMIHSLIEDSKAAKQDGDVLYYSVPANAINEETDADYHQKVLESIFNAYESEKGAKVHAFPINEGLALVYAELSAKQYSGIGISFGAGMVNLCFAIHGAPAFQFALVNSGDWIDRQAAKATGETPTFINKEKMKVDLNKEPNSLVERAIQTQYRIMVEKTVTGIKNGLEQAGKKVRTQNAVDIVIAGGTSLPAGFDTFFKKVVGEAKLPIQIGEIVRPKDALYSVARGCLIAAEAAN
jgi:hypothetical protein